VKKSRPFRITSKHVAMFCVLLLAFAGIKSCRSKKASRNKKSIAAASASSATTSTPATVGSATSTPTTSDPEGTHPSTESGTSEASTLIMSLSSGAECKYSTEGLAAVMTFLDQNESFATVREPRPKEGAFKAVLERINASGASAFPTCPAEAEAWLMRSLKLGRPANGNVDEGTSDDVRYGRSVGFILVNCHDRAEGPKSVGMGVLGWEFASSKGLDCKK
jgi:hypothetical protein